MRKKDDQVDIVVQSDLSVFCNPERLTDASQYDDPEILVGTGSATSSMLDRFSLEIAELFAPVADSA